MPFSVLADLASCKLNPPINTKFAAERISKLADTIPLARIEKIFTSPSQRCQDTAYHLKKFALENYGSDMGIVTLPELKEVSFDLMRLYPHKDVLEVSIETVNDAVFRGMTNRSLSCESAENAYKRIDTIFKSKITDNQILFVTHDFLMRVIEIYIKHGGVPRYPITYEELRNTRRNLYLFGLTTNPALDKGTVLFF